MSATGCSLFLEAIYRHGVGASEVFDHGEVEFDGTLQHVHPLLRGQAQSIVGGDELEGSGG
ncbi:hypothetical protein HEK616_84430 (plasmid) [Streptomyces nigrescens]|uniref:Uncharacterized protein n=1 Tax=Streptomyces nigrescens TaxID=1920 RepID=A0ABM8A898_STRNI|nr:hypothetical protein HEK616_84430 [Streptomyces nigrescens]